MARPPSTRGGAVALVLAVATTVLPAAADDVERFGLVELAAGVDTASADPYTDPVWAEIEAPDGAVQQRPLYWRNGAWWLRYQPQLPGEHLVTFLAGDAPVGSPQAFEAVEGPRGGPLAADGYGLRDARGAAFVPLGLNLGWSAGGGADDYERWFGALEAAGGNFARVWITHFTGQDPEWAALGALDEAAADEVDAILDRADDHGVRVLLVLWQHSELETPMWSSWDDNPYNAANGGPCADSACFFEDDAALAHQRVFLRYAVARWGPHPALGAWEVFNEVDGVTGVPSQQVAAWARDHAGAIRGWEGGLHMVSWSYSLPPDVGPEQDWQGADFSQLHSYLLDDVGPVTHGVGLLAAEHPPVLVGEWGLDFSGALDLEDSDGRAWHNASWAALAGGAAGNALTWWWDSHVEPDDLWWRLEGAAAVADGLDLTAMAPRDAAVTGAHLEVVARGDGARALAWVHDTRDDGEPAAVDGAELAIAACDPCCATFRDTADGGTIGTVEGADGAVEIPPFAGDVAALIEAGPCPAPPGDDGDGCRCAAAGGPLAGPALPALGGLAVLVANRRRVR